MCPIFKGCLLVLLAKWISTAEIICNLNQYTFRVSDSNTRCVNCPRCPAGFGTVPPCGAFLDHMVNVVCGVCVSGRTFSSSHDTTSCEPCTVCVDNEIAIKKCTRTSNTVCGKCKPGYYRSFVHSCEKCSPCCEDSEMEDHEEQCRRQGIPADRACQYTGRKCGEKAQDLPSDKPTADTGELEDDSILLKKWHVYLVAGLVVLLFILVVVTFVVRLPRVKITNSLKRKELTKWHNADERAHLCLASNLELNDALDGKSLSSISSDI